MLIVASTTRPHELAAKRGLVMDLWSPGVSSAVQELATAALCTCCAFLGCRGRGALRQVSLTEASAEIARGAAKFGGRRSMVQPCIATSGALIRGQVG